MSEGKVQASFDLRNYTAGGLVCVNTRPARENAYLERAFQEPAMLLRRAD